MEPRNFLRGRGPAGENLPGKFGLGFLLSGGKSVECSCDQHGRLLRRTQQRSGMHRNLSFVEDFPLLWTVLLGTNLGAFPAKSVTREDIQISQDHADDFSLFRLVVGSL